MYVGLDGHHAVRRVYLPTLTAELQFSLDTSVAMGLAVVPGDPNSVAVASTSSSASGSWTTVAVYTNGVARPVETGSYWARMLAFGSSPAQLYGSDGWGLTRMSVDCR